MPHCRSQPPLDGRHQAPAVEYLPTTLERLSAPSPGRMAGPIRSSSHGHPTRLQKSSQGLIRFRSRNGEVIDKHGTPVTAGILHTYYSSCILRMLTLHCLPQENVLLHPMRAQPICVPAHSLFATGASQQENGSQAQKELRFYSLFRDRCFSTRATPIVRAGSRLIGFYSLFRDRCFSTRGRDCDYSTEAVSIRCFATGASQRTQYRAAIDAYAFLFAVSRQVLLNRTASGNVAESRISFYSLFRDRCFSTSQL